jgi:hypothetical protein
MYEPAKFLTGSTPMLMSRRRKYNYWLVINMKIIDRSGTEFHFGKLSVGDVFTVGGEYYIKAGDVQISPLDGAKEYINCCAVQLDNYWGRHSGEISRFSDDYEVIYIQDSTLSFPTKEI